MDFGILLIESKGARSIIAAFHRSDIPSDPNAIFLTVRESEPCCTWKGDELNESVELG